MHAASRKVSPIQRDEATWRSGSGSLRPGAVVIGAGGGNRTLTGSEPHGILRTTAVRPRFRENLNILAFPANQPCPKPYDNYEDYEDRAREWDSCGTVTGILPKGSAENAGGVSELSFLSEQLRPPWPWIVRHQPDYVGLQSEWLTHALG